MCTQVSCFRFLLILCLFFQRAHLTHRALVLTLRLAHEKQSSCTVLGMLDGPECVEQAKGRVGVP